MMRIVHLTGCTYVHGTTSSVAPSDSCGITTGKQTILFSIGPQIIIYRIIYSRANAFMLKMDWVPFVYLCYAMNICHEILQPLVD